MKMVKYLFSNMNYAKNILQLFIIIAIILANIFLSSVLAVENFTMFEAVEYGLENNRELDFQKRNYELRQRRQDEDQFNFRVNFSGEPGYGTVSRENLSSQVNIIAERELAGGKVTGGIYSTVDPFAEKILSSNLNFSYSRNILPGPETENPLPNTWQQAQKNLKVEIVNSYLDILILKKEKSLKEQDYEIKEKKLASLKARAEEGEVLGRAQKQLELAREKLEVSISEKNNAYREFAGLLGYEKEEKLMLSEKIEPVSEIKGIDYWQKKALENDPGLQKIRKNLADLKQDQGKTWDFSDGDISLTTGLRNYGLLPEREEEPDLYFAFNFSKGLSFVGKLDRKEINLMIEKKEYELQERKNKMQKNIYDLYKQFLDIQGIINDQERNLLEQRSELVKIEKKYEQGLISSLELQEEMYSIQELELNLFEIYCDSLRKYIDVQKSAGILRKGVF
ncbi:MAG: TolC family protein [bacterium]